MFKKIVQQGRSDFDARSVLPVREYDKIARTPLVAFFNIPSQERHPQGKGNGPRMTRVSQEALGIPLLRMRERLGDLLKFYSREAA